MIKTPWLRLLQLFPDLTTVIRCWPAYHLLPSNLYKEFRMQLFVWYLTLVFVIMRHLDYNSSTGYLSSTELHLSYVCSCI